jgi:hypothetical protein
MFWFECVDAPHRRWEQGAVIVRHRAEYPRTLLHANALGSPA